MDYLIVDGFGLAFKSHFALSRFTTSSGVNSGCVYGFLTGLRSVKNKYSQCHVIITWDNYCSRRRELYAAYKANRPKFLLADQIVDLKNLFSNVNVSQAEYPGEEADDVIASLVKKYRSEGTQIFLYTSDKDMLQLVKNGQVIMIRPKSGQHPEKIYDEEEVKKEYGVSPDKLSYLFSFKGDSIDNIPGVPRVKSSLFSHLINEYHNIEDIYSNINNEKMTDFQRQSIVDFKQQVFINYDLVKLRSDLDVGIKLGVPNEGNIESVLNKYEIKAIKANNYIDSFKDISIFKNRNSPAVQSYSLFE